jgi:hypothetical protein
MKKISRLLVLLLFAWNGLQAQTSPPDNIPKVTFIAIFHPNSRDKSNTVQLKSDSAGGGRRNGMVAYPGNMLRFRISYPLEFLKTRPNDQSKVVLFLNGMEMKGMTANWYSDVTAAQLQAGHTPLMRKEGQINIVLTRNAPTQADWNFLYHNTDFFTDSYIDIREVSVGWENMAPLGRDHLNNTITIAFFYWWELLLWGLLYLAILVGFFFLAWKTDVIRESQRGAYSLSYTQLLFWTALVMGAFIYTLLLTDISTNFNSSVLYLMGISLSTTGFANAIDQHKVRQDKAVKKKHVGFFEDLLTDGNSYSVQRIQVFSWNLLLGVYFVIYTVTNKTMPEFPPTLLLLAGFSSTAYLAAKLPENTATPQPVAGGDAKTTMPSKS